MSLFKWRMSYKNNLISWCNQNKLLGKMIKILLFFLFFLKVWFEIERANLLPFMLNHFVDWIKLVILSVVRLFLFYFIFFKSLQCAPWHDPPSNLSTIDKCTSFSDNWRLLDSSHSLISYTTLSFRWVTFYFFQPFCSLLKFSCPQFVVVCLFLFVTNKLTLNATIFI